MFLSLAYLENSGASINKPLDVMKQMIRLDPKRVLESGLYPDEVVHFYEGARITLERDLRESGPPPKLAKRLAGLARADYVAFVNLVGGLDGAEVFVHVWDHGDSRFLPAESMAVESFEPEVLADAVSRLMSRHEACLREPVAETNGSQPNGPDEPAAGESPFGLQVNFAYASYWTFKNTVSLKPFGHIGANIGAQFFVTREFSVLAMVQFLQSQSDFSGLINDSFTTLRAFLGGEIGVPFWRFRLALGVLAEVGVIPAVEVCQTDIRLVDGDCSGTAVVLGKGTFVGVAGRPRLTFNIIRNFDAFVAGSTSFYLLPLSNNAVNFPTAFEAGLQYRF